MRVKKDKEKYVTRSFQFRVEYLTCTECAKCYSGSTPERKVFCQEFSTHVDPNETLYNQKVAKNCLYFVPDGMDRASIKIPEHERWYEKDSMG